MCDPIHEFAKHVAGTELAEIDATAVVAAKTFILDTLGVGIGGSSGPQARELVVAMQALGSGSDARVWSTGEAMPAPAAALCNAYQAHCQEFDCIHEAAVAHVLTVVLPAALAGAERIGGISGSRLIEAVVLGVDVAASIGAASASGLRFFRPGTVGLLGGTAALGKLKGFDVGQLVEAFSIAYAQMCGTMQAHSEGSGLLAMQMGFSARNAVTACELAAAGFTGPHRLLLGEFGYFRLFEDGGDPARFVARLGRDWRIAEVAHKPFPSGRATHGILDGCLSLQRDHGIKAGEITAIRLSVPPLIEQLVGRPPAAGMTINYARLCARYVLACALIGGELRLEDFTPEAYRRTDRQALAAMVAMVVRSGDNPNALVPIGIEMDLAGGRTVSRTVQDVYGTPANPMSRTAQLEKFYRNCAAAVRPLPAAQAEALVADLDRLEEMPDVRRLVDLAIG